MNILGGQTERIIIMPCSSCKSDRILSVSGKVSDCFFCSFKKKEYEGYVPDEIGIGSGDYIEFNYCLECGKIQDSFPKKDPIFESEDENDEGEIIPDEVLDDWEKDGYWTIKSTKK